MSGGEGDAGFEATVPVENGGEPTVETSTDDLAAQGWRRDRQNRWFTPAKGRSGVVYRRDNETVEEALARDAKGPKDRAPRSKKSSVPKAPAPTQVSLKELEFALSEVFCSPSFLAAGRGEEWAANHFTKEGPVLARNLTKAAEHNPWLRSKLEAAVTGEALMVKVMTIIPVAAALVAYSLPPVIYYFDPGFIPPEARAMFHVPEREKKDKPDAESAPSAETAKAPEPAAPVAAAA